MLKFGEAAREAVPVLEGLRQNDRDPRVREYAGRVLEAPSAISVVIIATVNAIGSSLNSKFQYISDMLK